MGEAEVSGRCLCGAVRLHVAACDPRVGVCHCRRCRRWTGSVLAVLHAPGEAVRVDGSVARFRAGEVERAFCAVCGSSLWFRRERPEAHYALAAGLFEAAADWPLEWEVYCDAAMTSVRLEGARQRMTAADYEESRPYG